jgi:tyrosinase
MPPAPALRTRKNQFSLSPTERKRYVNAILQMKKTHVYDWYVQTHIDSMGHPKSGGMNMWAHLRPAFLPWHRQFILDFENDLRDADAALTGKPSDLALPYWDWTIDRSKIPYLVFGWVWMDSFMGPNGSPALDDMVDSGPFSPGQGWFPKYDAGPNYNQEDSGPNYLQRTLGQAVDSLPAPEQWAGAMDVKAYDAPLWDSNVGVIPQPNPRSVRFAGAPSFRNVLEGWVPYYDTATAPAVYPALHNQVHMWVGGSMSDALSSPNDPVFFLHHCNVDRLWTLWQANDPQRPDQYLPQDGVADVTDPDGETAMGMKTGPNEPIKLEGHHLTNPMPPWNGTTPDTRQGKTGNLPKVTPFDVLNHTTLGYAYDTDPPSVTAVGTP